MLGIAGGLGIDRGGPLSSITDLFNGFNRVTGDSYTGGPTTVLDNTGALVTAPVNRMGITGGRFVDNAWTPFAADGSPIASSQSVRTRRGVVQKYASTFKGFLNEPARTNLFLNSGAPVTQNITTTAQQYTVSVRGSGSITLSGTATGVATEATPLTVTATAGTLTCTVSGSLTHAQVEAGAFKTSPITTAGASVLRNASVYSRPTANVLRANDWGVWFRCVPVTSNNVAFSKLFALFADANNNCYIESNGAGSITFAKKVGGAFLAGISATYTPIAGTPFEGQIVQSSSQGMMIRLKPDGSAWGAWAIGNTSAHKQDAPVGSTYSIGSIGAASHFAAHFPFVVPIMHADPKSYLEAIATRYP